MAATIVREKWTGKISTLVLGREPGLVRVGGESTLPFLHFEGEMPFRPVVALEVYDIGAPHWPQELTAAFPGALGDPVTWAKKCARYGADLICLTLAGAHPDQGDRSPEACAATALAVAEAVDIPLLVIGPGVEEKEAKVLEAVSEALKGRNCLLGCAAPANYRTIAASCLAHGHAVIASSPLDINLAKQLNILLLEMNLAPERIAIDPLVGALGYGLEYAYSIMERIRLSALTGDRALAMPVVCFVGRETWKTKEAKSSVQECPQWGDQLRRAVLWEALTATTLAQAGGAIMVLRHPESMRHFRAHVEKMMKDGVFTGEQPKKGGQRA